MLFFALVCFTLFKLCFCNIEIEEFDRLVLQSGLKISNDNERWNNFQNAKKEIKEMQKRYNGVTFKLNKLALMSENEQRKLFPANPQEIFLPVSRDDTFDEEFSPSIPDSFDFRNYGKVTPAKDQIWQICGSCWAFAAAGAIESQYLIRFNLSLDLSEQYMISCEKTRSSGCNSGSVVGAFNLTIKAGIPTEDCYPYTATNGTCSTKCDYQKKYHATSYQYRGTNESTYPAALYNYGPMVFSMYLPKALYYYSSGILDIPSSECTAVNNAGIHVMLLVGYTKDYWIAKNSFGPNWGENGFIRFKRGSNFCNMTSGAFSVDVSPSSTPPPTNFPVTLAPTTPDPSIRTCPSYDGITKLNGTWRNLILSAINEQRSKLANGNISSANGTAFPPAKNMRKLIYNCSIENALKDATDTCNFNKPKDWKMFASWANNRTVINALYLQGLIRFFGANKNVDQISQKNTSSYVNSTNFLTAYSNTISIGCWYIGAEKCIFKDGRTIFYCGIYPIPSGFNYEIGKPCTADIECTIKGVGKCDTGLGLCYSSGK